MADNGKEPVDPEVAEALTTDEDVDEFYPEDDIDEDDQEDEADSKGLTALDDVDEDDVDYHHDTLLDDLQDIRGVGEATAQEVVSVLHSRSEKLGGGPNLTGEAVEALEEAYDLHKLGEDEANDHYHKKARRYVYEAYEKTVE